MTSLELKNEELYAHLQSRLCTNVKQKPFYAQSHDTRHEESNKLAQNLFAGKDLEELDLAFTIVELKKQVFEEKAVNDRSDDVKVVIPNYKQEVKKMRCDLRESKYFEEPYKRKTLRTISGEELNPNLMNIFELSRQRREADVLNALRYNDFLAAYKANSKIAIFANDKENVLTEKEIKDEIMILIHLLNDDVETQCIARKAYENVRNRVISVLTDFLDLLVNKDY